MSTTPTGNLVKWYPPIANEPTPAETALHTRLLFNAVNDHDQAITLLAAKMSSPAPAVATTTLVSSPTAINPTVVPGSAPAVASEWINSYDATSGAFTQTQPAFSDISGIAATDQIGTGTPTAGQYVDGGTGAWTTIPSGGGGGFTTKTSFNATGRSFGNPFTNPGPGTRMVSCSAELVGGTGGDFKIQAITGGVAAQSATGTSTIVGSSTMGISFMVLSGETYTVNTTALTGSGIYGIGEWTEWD